jgi:hypothetical protein
VWNDRAQFPVGADFCAGGSAHQGIAVDVTMMFVSVQYQADRPTVVGRPGTTTNLDIIF